MNHRLTEKDRKTCEQHERKTDGQRETDEQIQESCEEDGKKEKYTHM